MGPIQWLKCLSVAKMLLVEIQVLKIYQLFRVRRLGKIKKLLQWEHIRFTRIRFQSQIQNFL